jgi:hypothetical protein
VPLDEVRGSDPARLLGNQRRHHHEDRDRETPEHVFRGAADDRPRQDQRSGDQVHPGEAPDTGHRPAGGLHVEDGVDRDHDQVGAGEDDSVVSEGGGNRQGDREEGRHPAEQGEPQRGPVGRNCVGEPGEGAVHPPDRAQHQDDLSEGLAVRPRDEHRRQLRDREDEDEIEEELERRDAKLVLPLWHRGRAVSHPAAA